MIPIPKRPYRNRKWFFSEGARAFVKEVEDYRPKGQKISIICDGFGCHIQYAVLKLCYGIMVLDLSAHTSSELQPLDKKSFRSFKVHCERLFNASARVFSQLDAFIISHFINLAYSQSFTVINIRSGFHNHGLCDCKTGILSVEPLITLLFFNLRKMLSRVFWIWSGVLTIGLGVY